MCYAKKLFNQANWWYSCCLHAVDGETPAKKSKKEKKKKKKKNEESKDEDDEEQLETSAAVVRTKSFDRCRNNLVSELKDFLFRGGGRGGEVKSSVTISNFSWKA